MKVAQYKCTLSPELMGEIGDVSIAAIKSLDAQATFPYEVLIWNNNENFGTAELSKFPKLQKLINWGTDDINIDADAVTERGIEVYKIDAYATVAVAEFVVSLLLAFERRHDRLILGEKRYAHELFGKKVGIIGLGKIGSRVATVLQQGFHCDVYYYSRTNKHLPHATYSPLAQLFKHCDYVVITVKSRQFVIDASILASANPRLVVVNVARDSVLPLKELIPFLRQQKVRGFIGDLSDIQTPPDLADQILITPHRGYMTYEARTIKHRMLAVYLARHCSLGDRGAPVYVVRHGQTEWNVQGRLQGSHDSPLTEEGERQAERMAEFFADKGIARIYSSPLGRARTTAEHIAHTTGAEVIVVPAFKEMSFGVFEGRERRIIEDVFADFFQHRATNTQHKLLVPYPGGESYADVYSRVLSPLLEAVRGARTPYVIVGHESVNRLLRGIMLDQPLETAIYARQSHNQVVKLQGAAEEVITL